VRHLLTVHSGLAPAFLARGRAHRWLARAALLGYAEVVAVSAAVRDALAGLGTPPGRLHVIPAFVGAGDAGAQVPGIVRAWRERFHPLVAWASHPSPVYGLTHALDALAALSARTPGVGAVVFGPGTGEAAFRGEAARRGLGGRVLGLGAISHAEALSVLREADLFWRPTLADGDALSVREAGALGTRCLASDAAPRPAGIPVYRAGDAASLARESLHVLARPAPPAAAGSGREALWSLYLAQLGGAARAERGTDGCAG
jgi:glycogen(starch) synthase